MNQATGQEGAGLELSARFAQSIERILPDQPVRLGVAVSGGGDSVALLTLLNSWANDRGCELSVVTVDHGLRHGSADECDRVAKLCGQLNLPHQILKWTGWDGVGNLQSTARNARYELISKWARDHGIDHVALGHTRDDQAETVLMRLARGSGVDGLSAMAGARISRNIKWLRPMLDTGRQELRDHLNLAGIGWVDDPSNEDDRFDRVKMRKALALLGPLGIDAENLSATATRMQSARQVLVQCTADAAAAVASVNAGAVFLEVQGMAAMADETRRRLLNHALCWVSKNPYGPRARALNGLWDRAVSGETATLHGCLIIKTKQHLVVTREPAAVAEVTCSTEEVWDQRWRLLGRGSAGLKITATGAKGLKTCPDWRDYDLPKPVLLAAPAIWYGDELVAAPVAGYANGWTAKFLPGANDFARSLLSH